MQPPSPATSRVQQPKRPGTGRKGKRDDVLREGPPPVEDCYFYMSTDRTGQWARFVEALNHLQREVPMRISPTGVSISVVGPERAYFQRYRIEAPGCNVYYFSYPFGMIEAGLRVNDMRNMLRGISQHSSYTMFITKSDTTRLGMCTYDEAHGTSYNHTLVLQTSPYEEMRLPEIVSDARISLNSRKFHDDLKHLAPIAGRVIYLGVVKGKIALSAQGDFGATTMHISTTLSALSGNAPRPETEPPLPAQSGDASAAGADAQPLSADAPSNKRKRPSEGAGQPRRTRQVLVVQNRRAKPSIASGEPMLGVGLYGDTAMTPYPTRYLEKFSKAFVCSSTVDLFVVENGILVLRYIVDKIGTIHCVLCPLSAATGPNTVPALPALVERADPATENKEETEHEGGEEGGVGGVPNAGAACEMQDEDAVSNVNAENDEGGEEGAYEEHEEYEENEEYEEFEENEGEGADEE